MPSKKKKYNARFPAGRIKKIMQTDEEVGKVAQAVPVIISRTLELFVESLLTKTLRVTNARNAKTLSPSHMKQCIMSESRFDFLRELVKNIPDISLNDELLELECGSPGEQTGDNSPTSAPSSPPPGFSRMHSYPNGQNSNRPLPNLHSLNMRSLDLPSTSSMNFYKETDANSVTPQHHHQPVITSTVIQHTSNHSNNINNNHSSNPSNNVNIRKDYGRPPKLARFDSAPCNLTLNTGYKIDLTPKINTPNISITNNNNNKPIYSIDLSKSFNLHHSNSLHKGHHTISTPPHQHDLPPVLKIDLSSTYQHLPSTSKEIPSPPIIKSDVCSTPTVKIDYSSIALTSSPLCSPTGPAPPISSPLLTVLNKPSEKPKMIPLPATITSNSNNNSYITAKEPTPSTASIDLTNIHTNSNFTNTKNMLSTNSLEMDEDYDDL